MKILHAITLADLGGAQSVLVNICNKAAEEGHDVYVVSEEYGKMWNLLSPKIKKIKINSLQRSINFKYDLQVFSELKSINKNIRPDIIHLHSSKMGAIGRLAFPANKTIYTVHGFDSVRIAFRKFLIVEKILKNKVRKIVAVSKYDETNLKNEGIYSNVTTIYNGISDVEKKVNLNPIIDFESLKKDYKIVMCIARLSPPKRFDLFCAIAEQMKNQKIKFVWIGNKDDEKIDKENIIMLGEIENAQNYLKYADVFILLSDYEGLPVSIIEALAHSKPVVASNVGGISEILNGQNGFAVENKSDQFVSKINSILYSPYYQDFCANARSCYKLHFTDQSMYSKYLELYSKILECSKSK